MTELKYIYLKRNNMFPVSASTVAVFVKRQLKEHYYFCFQFSIVLFLTTMDYCC